MASHSDLLFQTSDLTWQAYNDYGPSTPGSTAGGSLYGTQFAQFDIPLRAKKVSYNRPFHTREMESGVSWVFYSEYPMVRWLEANGYDVTYFSGVDTERNGSRIAQHKVFLSVGHDEYWSGNQRDNVEAARAAGVNLAFFSGNEVFWKTRWENGVDGRPYRTLVCYKETLDGAVIDPLDPPTWTGTWRDSRFSPPADGGRPENALTGTLFMVNGPSSPRSIIIPAADSKMRFWRNTTIAQQTSGEVALPAGSLGYEWDVDRDNGSRPAGLFHQSSATYDLLGIVLQDFGGVDRDGTVTHNLTLYRFPKEARAPNGSLVFGAGTVQWSWGLDTDHDDPNLESSFVTADVRMKQATVNLLADMGVQPANLQLEAGVGPATQTTDSTPPSSTITSPVSGATVVAVDTVIITGTATDFGGGVVGGVEVSVDGGTTWHPADGRANWTYRWIPAAAGTVNIRSRGVDDSGNLETPSAGVNVIVVCPCSIGSSATTPGSPDSLDANAAELGVKFRADRNGSITGIRFYKASANTGTHTGHLWSSTGQLLGSATFSGESPSGWQQVSFGSPISITAGTTYIASYYAPNGHFTE